MERNIRGTCPDLLSLVHQKRVSNEELKEEFGEAGKWVGIVMSVADFRKYIWSNKG